MQEAVLDEARAPTVAIEQQKHKQWEERWRVLSQLLYIVGVPEKERVNAEVLACSKT